MVHPLLWPASTTISSSSSPQTYAFPSCVRWGINLEKRLTGLAAVVVVMPLLIVGVRLAEDCAANQAKPNVIRVSGPLHHIVPRPRLLSAQKWQRSLSRPHSMSISPPSSHYLSS